MTSKTMFFIAAIFCVQIINSQASDNCAKGETMLYCGRMCEATCEKPYITEECKHTNCFVGGCGCDLDRGFVRDPKTDTCVKKANCS
ncbi:serine protease inhibitor swm-1-like [Microplitis demolitor]|uniref:serine protease inhibitor swm-1-like n=1 Tax=Microplitis demolitor TaxID=69319 RepID=UPI00235B700F|nr:serine protease inhibitor swm-1-like [Microplitis demolitor]